MILEDKIKIIQDLQCKHSQGLAAFDAGLSFGLCVETRMENNIKADQLVTLINGGTLTHTYVCVRVGNVLYLYTHALSATYADAPTITFSELNGLTTELNITPSPLLETQLSPILDSMNCLTSEHLCAIITETKSLLGDCNC